MEKEKILLDFSCQLLETGKDDSELQDIASKHLLQLPARDLAVFKCVYAYVDKRNKNGCTLPKKEVEKALATLNGKSVDFDHFRRKIVGFWLEGQIVKNEIHAYGVFFKGSLEDDYDELQDLLKKNELNVSFEAWGNKVGEPRDYELKDIEFAGGALLFNTEPAFDGARVLEMANKNKEIILELHKGSYSIYDFDTILRLLAETPKPDGEEDGFFDVEAIDFSSSTVRVKWFPSNKLYNVKLVPKIEKASLKAELIKEENLDKSSKDEQESNVEESHIMDEQIKTLEAEVASLKEQLEASKTELEGLKAQVEEANKKVTDVSAELAQEKASKEEAIKVAKEQATKITERRASLGEEYAKDMSDADILDDVKFENSQLKKENAELKKATKTTKEEGSKKDSGALEVGTKGKKADEISKKREKVQTIAFSN